MTSSAVFPTAPAARILVTVLEYLIRHFYEPAAGLTDAVGALVAAWGTQPAVEGAATDGQKAKSPWRRLGHAHRQHHRVFQESLELRGRDGVRG